MPNKIIAWVILILAHSPAFAWEGRIEAPARMWRSEDGVQNLVLIETQRIQPVAPNVAALEEELLSIYRERSLRLQIYGFTDMSLESAEAKPYTSLGTLMLLKFRYRGADGKFYQAVEKTYASRDRVRFTAHIFPLNHKAARQSDALLRNLEPHWFGRTPATERLARPELETCAECFTTQPDLPVNRVSNRAECKDVKSEDLKADNEEWWEGIYNNSYASTPIGCAQGVYSSTESLVGGAWKVVKGTWSLATDSRYREEVQSAVGYGLSAMWSHPIDTAKKIVAALIEEIAKNWEAIPCMNRRARTAMLCKVAADMVAGGYALKVLKYGFKGMRSSIAGLLNDALKGGGTKAEAIADAGATTTRSNVGTATIALTNTGTTTAAANSASNVASSALGKTIQSASPKTFPFHQTLAEQVAMAEKLGGLNDDVFSSRISRVKKGGSDAQVAADELRRMSFVMNDVLKASGDDFVAKVDNYLEKRVKDAAEKQRLRSCLVKP